MKNVSKKDNSEKESFMDGLKSYFKGVKSEWGKITWPERPQVISETFVVLGVVIFFTIIVYVLDLIFMWGLGLIPSR
ncbi:MAG: preprotein translocase subunit SecE [Bacteroidota bacterium]|nr:preprotein translocase subunit SecE [Bacteroidota bacterium]